MAALPSFIVNDGLASEFGAGLIQEHPLSLFDSNAYLVAVGTEMKVTVKKKKKS